MPMMPVGSQILAARVTWPTSFPSRVRSASAERTGLEAVSIHRQGDRDAKNCRVENKVFQRAREGKGRGTAESIVSGISRKGESRLGGAVCGCRSIDRRRSVRAEGSSSGCAVEKAV